MDWALVVTAVGTVAAITSAVTGLIANRLAHPRRLVEVRASATALLAKELPRLEVSFEDEAVDDPHVWEVEVDVRGKRDIESQRFDSGRPIAIEAGTAIVSELLDDDSREPDDVFTIDETRVLLGPTLLKHGTLHRRTYLTSGAPSPVRFSDPLIDADVRNGDQVRLRRTRVANVAFLIAAVIVALFLVTLFAMLVVSIISASNQVRTTNPRALYTAPVYSQPSLASAIVGSVDAGETVRLECSVRGDAVPLPRGSGLPETTLWYRIGMNEYVSDAGLDTGGYDAVVDPC